ncbi:MAG: hypothetical protein WB608_00035 [Terracidiphilus sp.]
MTTRMEKDDDALRSALRAARENEERWMKMSPEFSADSERMEQWRSIAKLRRREVERIETLLAEIVEHQASPQAEGLEKSFTNPLGTMR